MERADAVNRSVQSSGQTLLLVRHAAPSISDDLSYWEWPLSEEGRRSSVRAAKYIDGFQPKLICSSDERKARETAEIIADHTGIPIEIDPDLREHDRTGVPWRDASTRQRELEKLFAEPAKIVFGRESAQQARQRFTRAIGRAFARTPGPLVVVTHGTVMALFLSALTGRAAIEIWSKLGLSAVAAVDLRDCQLFSLVSDFRLGELHRLSAAEVLGAGAP